MNKRKIVQVAFDDAVRAAEETWASLERRRDPDSPGPPEWFPLQPNQEGEDGELRKAARVHVSGTRQFMDVVWDDAGWAVTLLDGDGNVLYSCGPGEFDVGSAADAVEPAVRP